jgi:anti-repressor protein
MTSEIQRFAFDHKPVRVVTEGTEVWFVAKDIAVVLEYSESSNPARLFQAVPDEWKGVKPIHTPYGTQEMVTISEQGLYFFLARSDKEKAIPFQRWLAGDVVPSVRRNGAYMTPETIQKTLSDPDFIIGLATRLKEEQRKAALLEATVRDSEPKVLFADAVSVSQSEILIGDLAKILKQNSIDIGQKRLFERLRNEGFLMKSGMSWNLPTQKAMDLGLFRVQEKAISKPDGSVLLSRTTRVTGKGQLYFTNYFLKKAPCVAF